MGRGYAKTMFTEAVRGLQEAHGSRTAYAKVAERGEVDEALGEFERGFVAARDSFYMASVTSDGWPYMQHRGGPKGLLRVLDEGRTLAFADFAGNKQYISAGNFETNDRVSLFLMGYPEQVRLKVIGHVRVVEAGVDAGLERAVGVGAYPGKLERVVVISVVAFDWNCSQHIRQRWTREEMV